MVIYTEIMEDNGNFNVSCSDMMGTNDTFGFLLHWYDQDKNNLFVP